MRKVNVFLWAFWAFLVVSHFVCRFFTVPEFDKILLGATVCSYFFSIADLFSFYCLRTNDHENRIRKIARKIRYTIEINRISTEKGMKVDSTLDLTEEEEQNFECVLEQAYGFIKQQNKLLKVYTIIERMLIFVGIFLFFVIITFYESKYNIILLMIEDEKFFSMFAFIILIGNYLLKDSILINDNYGKSELFELYFELLEDDLSKLEINKHELDETIEYEIEQYIPPRKKIKFNSLKNTMKNFIKGDENNGQA